VLGKNILALQEEIFRTSVTWWQNHRQWRAVAWRYYAPELGASSKTSWTVLDVDGEPRVGVHWQEDSDYTFKSGRVWTLLTLTIGGQATSFGYLHVVGLLGRAISYLVVSMLHHPMHLPRSCGCQAWHYASRLPVVWAWRIRPTARNCSDLLMCVMLLGAFYLVSGSPSLYD
jgi:hypothetical protein